MSKDTIGPTFTLTTNERQLEIFLMRDRERKEFQRMVDEHNRVEKKAAAEREKREKEDVAAEERALRTERLKLDHTPPWVLPMHKQREADIQAEAQRRVDARNAAAAQALEERHRAEQDDFIARQREERLQREAAERASREASQDRAKEAAPAMLQEFERVR